jgi:hypothetical protein
MAQQHLPLRPPIPRNASFIGRLIDSPHCLVERQTVTQEKEDASKSVHVPRCVEDASRFYRACDDSFLLEFAELVA